MSESLPASTCGAMLTKLTRSRHGMSSGDCFSVDRQSGASGKRGRPRNLKKINGMQADYDGPQVFWILWGCQLFWILWGCLEKCPCGVRSVEVAILRSGFTVVGLIDPT